MDRELITSDPMWEVVFIAVATIVNWLQTGAEAGDHGTQADRLGRPRCSQTEDIAT